MNETITRKIAVGILTQLIKQGVYRTNLMIISTLDKRDAHFFFPALPARE